MNSCVFWCEFIDLVVFFFRDRSHAITAKKTRQVTQEYIKGRSPLFIL